MSNIIVNAPIQNKEFSPDEKIGKAVPLFVTDWLRTSDTRYEGQRAVDLWNSVLASEQGSHTDQTYAALSQARLQRKYDSRLLGSIRDDASNRLVLSDADSDFHQWASGVIEHAIELGDMTQEQTLMHVCDDCDAAISMAEGPKPRACAHCASGTVFHVEERQMLVTYIDSTIRERVGGVAGRPSAVNVPARTSIVNRRRLNGISLEKFGHRDEAVDPRIGLGLLAMYAAAMQDADGVDVVTSRATAGQNLPQFFAAVRSQAEDLPDFRVRQAAKAPANYLMHLRTEGTLRDERFGELMKYILPPVLLSMKHDMSPATLEQIAFSKKKCYTCK